MMINLLKQLAEMAFHSTVDDWLKSSKKEAPTDARDVRHDAKQDVPKKEKRPSQPRYIVHTASKVHHNDVVYVKGEWRWITKVVYSGGARVYMETQCGHKFSRAWDDMVRVRC
ncbi:hypothetical protein [Pseudomonas sp. LB1P83]